MGTFGGISKSLARSYSNSRPFIPKVFLISQFFSGASSRVVNCNIGVCYYPRLSCCDPYAHEIINGTHACGPQPNYTTPYAPYDANCTLPPATCCPPGGTWSEWTQTPTQCTGTVIQISR